MIKYDLRHNNNTKHQRLLRLIGDKWCELSGKYIDLSEHYKNDIVEYNDDIIEISYKGKIVSLDVKDETSTLNNIEWLIDIETESGYIIKNVLIPRQTCSSELYNDINNFRVFLENKVQNNIGNFQYKENYKKINNELDKIIQCKKIKTFVLRNLLQRENLQDKYPILWKEINI